MSQANAKKRAVDAKTKGGLFGLALLGTCILEICENIEDGDNAFEAAGKAFRRTKTRAKVLKRTEHEVEVEERKRPR